MLCLSRPATDPARFFAPVRFLARKAEWGVRRNCTPVLFSWSHQATDPVRLDTATWSRRYFRDFFSFCASISHVGVPSHEIVLIRLRYFNIFHCASIYQKLETIVTKPASKLSKLSLPVDGVTARVMFSYHDCFQKLLFNRCRSK